MLITIVSLLIVNSWPFYGTPFYRLILRRMFVFLRRSWSCLKKTLRRSWSVQLPPSKSSHLQLRRRRSMQLHFRHHPFEIRRHLRQLKRHTPTSRLPAIPTHSPDQLRSDRGIRRQIRFRIRRRLPQLRRRLRDSTTIFPLRGSTIHSLHSNNKSFRLNFIRKKSSPLILYEIQ